MLMASKNGVFSQGRYALKQYKKEISLSQRWRSYMEN